MWSFLLYSAEMPDPSHPLFQIVERNPNCELRILHSMSTLLFETVQLPRALRRDRVDVFLATIPETRLLRGTRTLLTIHDVIPELFPWNSPLRLRILRATGIVRRNVARCSEVLCFSNHTANDVKDVYGIPADRVNVARLGVDPGIQRVEGDVARTVVADRFHIKTRFFLTLYVADHGAFFRAYATYLERERAPIPLVVVCGTNPAGRMRAEVARLGLSNAVQWLGEVTDDELSALYSACAAFVYPSLYEGFGLPVLEALACRAICITFRVSSMPEVVGSAGLLIDPGDIAGFVAALQGVTDEPNAVRAMYKTAIEEVSGNVGWELTAQAVRSSLARISLRTLG
jgi:glycosyltransferase involved in cell wall biosynthesis